MLLFNAFQKASEMSVPLTLEITSHTTVMTVSWKGSKMVRSQVAVVGLANEQTLAMCCHLEEQITVQYLFWPLVGSC